MGGEWERLLEGLPGGAHTSESQDRVDLDAVRRYPRLTVNRVPESDTGDVDGPLEMGPRPRHRTAVVHESPPRSRDRLPLERGSDARPLGKLDDHRLVWVPRCRDEQMDVAVTLDPRPAWFGVQRPRMEFGLGDSGRGGPEIRRGSSPSETQDGGVPRREVHLPFAVVRQRFHAPSPIPTSRISGCCCMQRNGREKQATQEQDRNEAGPRHRTRTHHPCGTTRLEGSQSSGRGQMRRSAGGGGVHGEAFFGVRA